MRFCAFIVGLGKFRVRNRRYAKESSEVEGKGDSGLMHFCLKAGNYHKDNSLNMFKDSVIFSLSIKI